MISICLHRWFSLLLCNDDFTNEEISGYIEVCVNTIRNRRNEDIIRQIDAKPKASRKVRFKSAKDTPDKEFDSRAASHRVLPDPKAQPKKSIYKKPTSTEKPLDSVNTEESSASASEVRKVIPDINLLDSASVQEPNSYTKPETPAKDRRIRERA